MSAPNGNEIIATTFTSPPFEAVGGLRDVHRQHAERGDVTGQRLVARGVEVLCGCDGLRSTDSTAFASSPGRGAIDRIVAVRTIRSEVQANPPSPVCYSTPLFLDLDDFIQRDREAEFAKIRSRRAEREQMRKVYRKRRAIAVAVLALPIAGFVFAGKFPSDSKKPSAPATAPADHRGGRSRHHRQRWPGAVRRSRPRCAPRTSRCTSRTTRTRSRSIISAYDANTGLNAVQLDIKNENGDIGFTEDMPSLAIKSGSAHDFYEPRVDRRPVPRRPAST